MKPVEVVTEGAVTEDGRLIVNETLHLPPGRVRITLRPIEDASAERHPMFETLRRIWAEQDARGFKGRTGEEIVADVRAMRDEWEAHQRGLEQLQERLQASRARRAEEAE